MQYGDQNNEREPHIITHLPEETEQDDDAPKERLFNYC